MEENLERKKQVTEDGVIKNLYSNTNTLAGEKLGIPAGYRLCPAADELVMDYLMNKIMGYELPNAYDPHELPTCDDRPYILHFFTLMQQGLTEIEQKEGNRITKGGYWAAIGAEMKIYHEGEVVGYRNTFLFYTGQAPNGKKSSWVMQEFRVNPNLVCVDVIGDSIKTKFERYVVCRIRNMAI